MYKPPVSILFFGILWLVLVGAMLLPNVEKFHMPMFVWLFPIIGVGIILWWFLSLRKYNNILNKGDVFEGVITGFKYRVSHGEHSSTYYLQYVITYNNGVTDKTTIIDSLMRAKVDPEHPIGTKVLLKVYKGTAVIIEFTDSTFDDIAHYENPETEEEMPEEEVSTVQEVNQDVTEAEVSIEDDKETEAGSLSESPEEVKKETIEDRVKANLDFDKSLFDTDSHLFD